MPYSECVVFCVGPVDFHDIESWRIVSVEVLACRHLVMSSLENAKHVRIQLIWQKNTVGRPAAGCVELI
jgi:hypothetical protein